MAAVRAFIDTVNELAQAPLRAGGRVWRGAGPSGASGAKRATEAAKAGTELPAPVESKYAHGNLEPSLEELLGDPMVHLVMRADRLEPADVRRALSATPPVAA